MKLQMAVAAILGLVAGLSLGTGPSPAGDLDDSVVLDILPPPVAAATRCAEEGPGFATRRVFAGHVIFSIECPSNHANFNQSLVAADDDEGWNAQLLVFPTPFPPDPDSPYDMLSNIGWHEGGVVSELSIDPEEIIGPCRHEARWRLAGPVPTPELVFWRETHDCEGNGGWTVLVDR